MDVGIIIITHGDLAEGLKNSLFSIVGEKQKIDTLNISSECSLETICDKLRQKIIQLNTKKVVIFTDMLGGTPCNVSLKTCCEMNGIYIISGVNLYMLITAVNLREQKDLVSFDEYINKIIEEGKKNIVNVKEFFKKISNK